MMEEINSDEESLSGNLVSEFSGVRSKVSQVISIKQYFEKIQGDEFKDRVVRYRTLRQQPGHEAEAQAIKGKMPCIIPAGICQGGHAASNLIELSHISSIDLDYTDERTEEVFGKLKELPYVVGTHKSISGNGCKAFVLIAIQDSSEYNAYYAAVSAAISSYVNHPCDPKCKDITRPCFYSWHPEAYFNPDAIPFRLPETEKSSVPENTVPTTPVPATPVASVSHQPVPQAPAPGFLAQFVSDFEHLNPFVRGERNDIALKLGRMARSKGFSIEELEKVTSVFSQHWSNADFTAEDIRQRVQAGYQFISTLPKVPQDTNQGPLRSRVHPAPQTTRNDSEEEDVLLENNNELRASAPYFPEEVYEHLPPFLKDCVKYANNPREKDITLLSCMNCCAACLPGTRFIYKNAEFSPNFYSAIQAPSAAGKGVVGFCIYLLEATQKHYDRLRRKQKKEFEENMFAWETEMQKARREKRKPDINLKPEEPKYIYIKIPSTISKSRLIAHLRDNGPVGGSMTSTEIYTMISAISQECGNFTDILCKAAQHEEVASSYKVDGDPISVQTPYLSLLLSGTQEQFIAFFQSLEDGLYNRFSIYTRQAQYIWESCAPKEGIDLRTYFRELGEQLAEMHLHLLEFPTRVTFSEAQWEEHTRQFSELLDKAIIEGTDAPGGIIFRHGLLAMRIAALLTVFRKWEDFKFAKEYRCSDEDFNTAMSIIHVLIEHSLLMSTALPASKHPPVAIHSFHRVNNVLNTLPTNFTYTEFLNAAHEKGISTTSVKRMLKKAQKCELIIKQEDTYQKTGK